MMTPIDYRVYLVTDSKLNHPSRTLTQTVEDAILGGATIVQLREKQLSAEVFIELAQEVHTITKKYNIPLIINDNIEVLLAVDAEGLHIGQDDIPCREARRRLGPNVVLGVSVSNVAETQKAIEDGADYVGIPAYTTQTKPDAKNVCFGHIGIREILESIPPDCKLKTVGIAGIKEWNAQRIMRSSFGSNGRRLDGVAVVSAIMGAENATSASRRLVQEVNLGRQEVQRHIYPTVQAVLESVPDMLRTLRRTCPLIHNITNLVVVNDSANCTLALGGSPVMSTHAEEAEDLQEVASALVINLGHLSEPYLQCMVEAGKHANLKGRPVVLDPVAVGASRMRRDMTRKMLNAVRVDIIKGNGGEISTIADILGCSGISKPMKMRGVDSIGEIANPAELVRAVANREGCVVAMTGKVDYVSDGQRTLALANGHEYQSQITGSGCMVTAAIGCFAGTSPDDPFAAAVAGILCMNLAGEHAARRDDVKGPGTFRAAFIDEMANLRPDDILKQQKVTIL